MLFVAYVSLVVCRRVLLVVCSVLCFVCWMSCVHICLLAVCLCLVDWFVVDRSLCVVLCLLRFVFSSPWH